MPDASFFIRICEPYTVNAYLPPEDALGELSDAELKLRRFCFEHNHNVAVGIEDEKRIVLLFPDVALAFAQMRAALDYLESGKECQIDFPESGLRVQFEPKATDLECRLEDFGYSSSVVSGLCNKADVIAALRQITEDVLSLSLEKKYLTADQAEQLKVS